MGGVGVERMHRDGPGQEKAAMCGLLVAVVCGQHLFGSPVKLQGCDGGDVLG